MRVRTRSAVPARPLKGSSWYEKIGKAVLGLGAALALCALFGTCAYFIMREIENETDWVLPFEWMDCWQMSGWFLFAILIIGGALRERD